MSDLEELTATFDKLKIDYEIETSDHWISVTIQNGGTWIVSTSFDFSRDGRYADFHMTW